MSFARLRLEDWLDPGAGSPIGDTEQGTLTFQDDAEDNEPRGGHPLVVPHAPLPMAVPLGAERVRRAASLQATRGFRRFALFVSLLLAHGAAAQVQDFVPARPPPFVEGVPPGFRVDLLGIECTELNPCTEEDAFFFCDDQIRRQLLTQLGGALRRFFLDTTECVFEKAFQCVGSKPPKPGAPLDKLPPPDWFVPARAIWCAAGQAVCAQRSATGFDALLSFRKELSQRLCLGCGNGRLEQEFGEQCDDGNTRESDCCTKECKLTSSSCPEPDVDPRDCVAKFCEPNAQDADELGCVVRSFIGLDPSGLLCEDPVPPIASYQSPLCTGVCVSTDLQTGECRSDIDFHRGRACESDEIACTHDVCGFSGMCNHLLDHNACSFPPDVCLAPLGCNSECINLSCDPQLGCVGTAKQFFPPLSCDEGRGVCIDGCCTSGGGCSGGGTDLTPEDV